MSTLGEKRAKELGLETFKWGVHFSIDQGNPAMGKRVERGVYLADQVHALLSEASEVFSSRPDGVGDWNNFETHTGGKPKDFGALLIGIRPIAPPKTREMRAIELLRDSVSIPFNNFVERRKILLAECDSGGGV
jgi:hypothetical protein